MKFTADWFTNNIPNFEACMSAIVGESKFFLEIGVYEGRSTCWLLRNGLDHYGSMYCIDYFHDSDIKARFDANVDQTKGSKQLVFPMPIKSYNGLAELISKNSLTFNFIYIDGAHDARNTLTDACMAWGMLAKGGVMLFDDYEWSHGETPQERPKLAVDSFLEVFKGEYEILLKNYQVAIRRL